MSDNPNTSGQAAAMEHGEPQTPKAESAWQPIETAPKDGEEHLLLFELHDGINIGSWDLNTDWRHEPGGWPLYPTHWQRLPSPPEREAT